MQAGETSSFEYQHYRGGTWTASMQVRRGGGLILLPEVLDPEFEHVGPYPSKNRHKDKRLEYRTGDESLWSCVCQARILSADLDFIVGFTFEHLKLGIDPPAPHESDHIELLDGMRRCWLVYANNVSLPGTDPVQVKFRLVQKY